MNRDNRRGVIELKGVHEIAIRQSAKWVLRGLPLRGRDDRVMACPDGYSGLANAVCDHRSIAYSMLREYDSYLSS